MKKRFGDLDEKTIARFWSKVDKNGDCWLWMGGKRQYGYGTFFQCGRFKKQWSAHRLAWFLTSGPIQGGMSVCHRCDVPACVNPGHLFLGTNSDNMRDMVAKGRNVTPKNIGSANSNAKLSEADIPKIRELRASGLELAEIANRYGVSAPTICGITRGGYWRHV